MLTGCADINSANPPLFIAFRQFCADTHSIPDKVEEAVEAAGGKLHASGALIEPYSVEVTSWDVAVEGHEMVVSTGTARMPKRQERVQDTEDCTVVSLNREDSSVAVLDRWAGVPAVTNPGTSQSITYYYFRDDSAGRVGVDAKEADGTAHWMMTVRRAAQYGSVQLTHFSAAVATHDSQQNAAPE
jgi:hypothetical protein